MKDKIDFHQTVMGEAYELWQENRDWRYPEFVSKLNALQKAAVLLGNLNYQVENGGWTQWGPVNNYMACADEVLEVLRDMAATCPLAPTVAKMVRDLVKAHEEAESLSQSDFTAEAFGYDEDDEDFYSHDEVEAYEDAVDECYCCCDGNDDLYYKINDDFMVQSEVYLRRLAGQDIPEDVLKEAAPALTRSLGEPEPPEPPEPERKRPRVKLTGVDGNAFTVMGRVCEALRKSGFTREDVDTYRKEAMSGDYNHLLVTSMKWCEVY